MNKKAGAGFVIFWSAYKRKPKIQRIVLSKNRKSFPNAAISSSPRIDNLANQIAAFLAGKDIRFPLNMIRLDLCSVFQQKVLRAAYAIPRGRVSTYQLIAKLLGKPNAARAVGMALAGNPFPIVIPCHRVIRSDRALGGYQAGLKMKRTLLKMEGVSFL